jgi:multiple sugar transport system substrate-binding protein
MSIDRRSKWMLGTCFAWALALGIVGCAAYNPTPDSASISFSFGSFDYGDRDFADYLSVQLQEFQESHPDISVDLRRSRDGSTDCFTGLASNLGQQRESGEILVLDPFVEQDDTIDMADFYPSVSRLFVSEGEILGIPASANVIVMYYNQDLFDRYSVPYPQPGWTWAEFLAKGLALRDPDAQVFGYVIPQGATAFDPALFVYQHGGRIFDDLQNPTQPTFDDPLTVEALEWYEQLINEHNIAPTSEQIRATYGAAENALYRGILQDKFGMWMGWFSERGGLAWPVSWPMQWGMVQLPRDANSFTGGLVEGYFISAGSNHPQACWELISYLSHQLPYSSFPVRRSIAESDVYSSRVGNQVAAVGRASLQDALLLSPEAFAGSDALEIFAKAIDDVVQRRATAEEAMGAAQQKAEASQP